MQVVAKFESFTDSARQWSGSGAWRQSRQDAEPERTGMYLQRVAGAATDSQPITKPHSEALNRSTSIQIESLVDAMVS